MTNSLCIYFFGQLRIFYYTYFNTLELIKKLIKHYKIYIFFYINFDNTIANWKNDKNKKNLNECYKYNFTREDFSKIIEKFEEINNVYIVEIIEYTNIYDFVKTEQKCFLKALVNLHITIFNRILKYQTNENLIFTKILVARPDLIFYNNEFNCNFIVNFDLNDVYIYTDILFLFSYKLFNQCNELLNKEYMNQIFDKYYEKNYENKPIKTIFIYYIIKKSTITNNMRILTRVKSPKPHICFGLQYYEWLPYKDGTLFDIIGKPLGYYN